MFEWLCKPKLSEVLELYLNNQKLSFSTKRLTRQAWGQMVKEVGDIRIGKFGGDEAEKTLAFWLKETSPNTTIIYRKTVSPLFSWAIEKKYIKANPFAKVKPPKATKKQVRVYEPFELRRLLQACDNDIRWVATFLLAITTGMRKSAMQNLTRQDICFESELVLVREKQETNKTWFWRPKDREERKLPLVPLVAKLLTEIVYAIPSSQPYIFLKPARYFYLIELKKLGQMTDEHRLHPVSSFDRKFRKIKHKAGVEGRFHDLRATCLTDLASVLNPNELAVIGGHSDVETTLRYVGIGSDTVNKARLRVNESVNALATPSHAR